MADENVYVEKVLLGETTAEAVEKINKAITQINQNMDDIDEAGKVDEVQVNGTNAVVSKKVNFKNGTNVTMTASGGTVTVSSKDTKNTTGAGPMVDASSDDGKLYPVGVTTNDLGSGSAVTYTGGEATYIKDGVLYTSRTSSIGDDGSEVTQEASARVLNETDRDELEVLIGNLAGGMRYRGAATPQYLPYNNQNTGSAWGSGVYKEALAKGDTLKVGTAGYFYVQYTNGSVDSTVDSVHADVGDLFILNVLSGYNSETGEYTTVKWELIPSGDDGDVYSDDTPWTAGGYILTTAANSTAAKKITKSSYKIGTTLDSSTTTVPTNSAVKTYTDTVTKNMVTADADLNADEILFGSGSKTAKASGYTISTSAPSSSDSTKIPTSSAVATALSNKTTNMVTASSTLTADQFLYGGGSKTAKASGLTKTTSISDADNAVDTKIPTEKAVRTLVDSVTVQYAKAVRIGSDTFTLSETITDENEEPKYYVYKSAEAYYGYIPVVVYNSAYQSMVIEMRSDVPGYVYLVTSPDEAIFGELRYVILNKVFPINS